MNKQIKIVIIGAGSAIFTKTILSDLLAFQDVPIREIALVDINEEKLRVIHEMTELMAAQVGRKMKVSSSCTWRDVLDGADFVINTIGVGGAQIYQRDLQIADKYGVSESVGDIIGPTGIFRMLRAYPAIRRMVKDVEEICPDAYFFNYTNPMAPICLALSRESKVKIFGFCHSVQGTAKMLASYLDVDVSRVSYWCAGINHMAWYQQFKVDGEDAYPKLRQIAADPALIEAAARREKKYNGYVGSDFSDAVRFEIMKYFEYFNSESPFHMSEYTPYFRKNEQMIKDWHVSIRWWLAHELGNDDYYDTLKKQVEVDRYVPMDAGEEYAPKVIRATVTGRPFRANLNVMNTGLISNIPSDCCVEVPCYADSEGIHPCYVGNLPNGVLGLNMSNISVHKLMADAAVEKKLKYIHEAVQLDPLTGAQCTLEQINALVNELIDNNAAYLKDFT